MDSAWVWLGLALGVQWFVICACPEREGMGRIFSRPLHRFRLFSPPKTRLVQWMSLFVILLILEYGLGISDRMARLAYFVPWISFYLDDYITGDDDKWKKFWEGVRNKIKWKMKLPQPETGSRTA